MGRDELLEWWVLAMCAANRDLLKTAGGFSDCQFDECVKDMQANVGGESAKLASLMAWLRVERRDGETWAMAAMRTMRTNSEFKAKSKATREAFFASRLLVRPKDKEKWLKAQNEGERL